MDEDSENEEAAEAPDQATTVLRGHTSTAPRAALLQDGQATAALTAACLQLRRRLCRGLGRHADSQWRRRRHCQTLAGAHSCLQQRQGLSTCQLCAAARLLGCTALRVISSVLCRLEAAMLPPPAYPGIRTRCAPLESHRAPAAGLNLCGPPTTCMIASTLMDQTGAADLLPCVQRERQAARRGGSGRCACCAVWFALASVMSALQRLCRAGASRG